MAAKITGTAEMLLSRALEAEAQLNCVLESIEDGIAIFDCKGNVVQLNDRFAQLLGFEPQATAESQTWDGLALLVAEHFDDSAKFLDRWGEVAVRPAEPVLDELAVARPVRRILQRRAGPVLGPNGEVTGRLEIYRDITAARHDFTDILQTEKMAELGQLVSGIAHELNNPLTSIMGYSQLLLGRALTPAQAADGRLIFQEAERAARIVRNLLFFARSSRMERRVVDLNEIVERALALREYELRLENIHLERELALDLPPVLADAPQIQQAILNLLVNAEYAVRQSGPGGAITVRTRRAAPGRVALQISDSGAGIPAEILPRIFDPFFSTKPPGAGTGLGLSITFSIIQDHDGQISAESQPGRGAKFTVELPVAERAPETAATPIRLDAVPPRPRVMQSARILVVEDEPSVAHLIADVLADEGHPVEVILDGRDGLARALAGGHDLVIMDLRMPHLDGHAIYRELVARHSPLRDRLIFVTGDTFAPRTLKFLESSGRPYLAKPFLVEELKEVVSRALAEVRRAGNSGANGGQERIAPHVHGTKRS
jgi:PAS domain S-box-containing protein